MGVEGLVPGLRAGDLLGHELAEDVVDPVEHGRPTVRKFWTSGTGAAGREAVARGEEHGDVGAAEPVDRLLGVADEEQSPGFDGYVGPSPDRSRPRPSTAMRMAISIWIGSVSWNSSSSRRW